MSEKQTLKFVVNTNYDNKEYGPDFAEDTAEVGGFFAEHLLKTGRCVEAGQPDNDPGEDAGQDDPVAARRAELKSLNVPELRKLAKPLEIDTNGINKDPLIEAIIEAES